MAPSPFRLAAAAAFLMLIALFSRPAAAESVDLELVFAADGSGSIDDDELRLQRRGWAEALASKEVLDAVRAGPLGAIAVAYMEWGGPQSQVLIVDWHVIRDEPSARAFGDRLLAAPRGAVGWNSISNAIDFSVRLADGNAIEGTRKVIDVSGDGPKSAAGPFPRRGRRRWRRVSPSTPSPSGARAGGPAGRAGRAWRTIIASR